MPKFSIYFLCFGFLPTLLIAQTINPDDKAKTALQFKKQFEITTSVQIKSSLFNYNTESNAVNLSSYSILPIKKKGANVQVKVLKIKTKTSSSIGKETNYDSDNPQAGDSKPAEHFNGMVGDITTYSLDKDAIVVGITRSKKFIDVLNKVDYDTLFYGKVFDAYLNVKTIKNIGDIWADSIITAGSKTVEHYTYKSYENGLATIELKSINITSQKMEDAEIETNSIAITTNTNDILQVDITTLLIKKKIAKATSLNLVGEKEKATSTSITTDTIETIF